MASDSGIAFDHIHLISADPHATAAWYVDMLGAEITDKYEVRGAPQICVAFGDAFLLIRGARPGEDPSPKPALGQFAEFASHDQWGTDHFGFLYEGDLTAFCDGLRAKGVTFPVELKQGENGSLLCYVAAPDGISIELMEC